MYLCQCVRLCQQAIEVLLCCGQLPKFKELVLLGVNLMDIDHFFLFFCVEFTEPFQPLQLNSEPLYFVIIMLGKIFSRLFGQSVLC